jgi:hypothetical protein
MTTGQTLSNIFFEPGRVFDSFRARPRFLVAGAIIIGVVMLFTMLLYQRVGYENIVRETIENSPQTAQMDQDQKERAIAMQTGPIFKTIAYVSPLIAIALFFAIGAALYLLGTSAMGKAMTYPQALALWVYSSFPPTILAMLANIILLFVRPPDPSDAARARGGLVHANLGLFIDRATHPVLATALGAVDIFAIYGLVLAVLGLRKIAKLSSGAAWTIVLVIYLLGVIIKIAVAAFSGNAMA